MRFFLCHNIGIVRILVNQWSWSAKCGMAREWPPGGLVLGTAVVFSANLSVVILAFALNGLGFIAVFTCVGGPLQLAV